MHSGSQFDEKNVHSEETNELVLDGGFPLPKEVSQDGFMAPEINSFGHSFRFQFHSIFFDLIFLFLYKFKSFS